MRSKIQLFILPICFYLWSCHSNGSSGRDTQLLTGAPWKYEKAGFDSNEDGIFDALDPRITGSEKDTRVIFRKDGTGTSLVRSLSGKASEPYALPFIWAFQNNDSTIYFQGQYYTIKTLTDKKLEIYIDQKLGESRTRYIIIFGH